MSSNLLSGPPATMPAPVVHWPHYRYAKWLVGGLMLLWTFALWYMSRAGARWLGPQFFLLVMPIHLHAITFNVRCVLTDGVLSIVRATGTVQSVPLATVEVERWFNGMRIRWSERKRTRSMTTTFSAPFMEELKRAVRSAGPGSTPASEAATFGFPATLRVVWAIVLFIVMTIFLGAATYWHQPLLLLPWALLALLIDRKETSYLLMRSGEYLWVLTPSEAPHPISLRAVQAVTDESQSAVITTRDAAYPEIRVARRQSSDLLKQLTAEIQR